jgi:hypothetical protein
MRNIQSVLILASLLSASCSSSSGTQSSTQTTTTTTTTQTTAGGNTTTTSSADADAGTATDGGAATAGSRRAQIAREVIETCTPEGAGVMINTNVRPVEARIAPTLGGCGFRTPAAAPTERAIEFDVFSEASYVAEHLVCPPNRSPAFQFTETTYARFSTVHASNDHWEIAFAVNDGQRVHVGVRLRRQCQGVAPTTGLDSQGIEVPGRDLALTLHRCAPIRTPCNVP